MCLLTKVKGQLSESCQAPYYQGNCNVLTAHETGKRDKLVFCVHVQGWAVRSAEPIACGTFICEYIGEVLNDREANKRGER
jgi:hypothetical protein